MNRPSPPVQGTSAIVGTFSPHIEKTTTTQEFEQ
jgi:hypothetical protein